MTLTLDDIPVIALDAPEFQDIVTAEEAVADAREGVGVVRSARGLEILTHAGAAEVMRNLQYNAAVGARLSAAGISEGVVYETFVNALQNREGAAHTRARKVAGPWFNANTANRLREHVRVWVGEWLDAQSDVDVVDFHNAIGRRLPSTLFCHMVGVSADHWTSIAQWSEDILLLQQAAQPGTREIVETSATQAKRFIDDLLEERLVKPGDDLVSFLVQAQERGEADADDVMAILWLALFGSTDTTTGQLNLNLVTLSEHPEAWKLLREEPDLVPNAVLELSRFNPNVWAVMRSPKESMEYRGIPVGPEDTLWPAVYAANFDPKVFDDPRRLDLRRPNAHQLLNFATGTHSCLGRMITIMEQEEVLRAIVERWAGCEVLESKFAGAMYAARAEGLKIRFH